MKLSSVRAPAMLVSSVLLLAACGDEDSFVGPLTPEGCLNGGRSYSGEVAGGTWTRNRSPHVLEDSVVVSGRLEIEPGTLVCGRPGSVLTVTELVAVGAAEAPIVFTAAEPAGWGGIRARSDSATLRHARIENTVIAIAGRALLENVHIIRSSLWAAFNAGTLRHVVIDSACTGGPGCAAVSAAGYAVTVLENVTIRDSGDRGITATRRSGLALDDVLIEGSAGYGLWSPWEAGGGGYVTVVGPLRITGGQSYPAVVHGFAAARLLGGAHADEVALTGNARDTLVIDMIEGLGGPHIIRKELPWHVRTCSSFAYQQTLGTITVQAGASLTVSGNCRWVDLRAEGTATEPAIIRSQGLQLHSRAMSPDTARLRHAVLHDIWIRADSAPIIFENVRMTGASVELLAAGSRIDGLHSVGSIEIVGSTEEPAAVTLGAGTSMQRAHIEQARRDGVLVNGAGVTISHCTSTGNARHGISVTDGAPVIRDCNLYENGGVGVSSAAIASVDAVENWWGDAAGPLGPAGDGFDGDVQYEPFLTAPAQFTCGPECISPGAANGFVLEASRTSGAGPLPRTGNAPAPAPGSVQSGSTQ